MFKLNLCQSLVLLVVFAPLAFGQQFTEESSTRFPDPTLSEYTNQITVGDIDSDGDLDLIFANGRDYISQGPALIQRVYVNDGMGNFSDESLNRLNFSGWARGVEMGDIDNDGDLDLIFSQDFDHLPRLFLNDGGGFFTDVTLTQLPNITLASSRAQFADFDNDGDLDLYINNGGTSRFGCGQNRIYENDGLGFFTDQTAAMHPIGNICEPMDVSIADIDGDFDLDVRTGSTGNNNSRLFKNDGTGVLNLVGGVPNDSTCYSYDFGDIDGDGDMDLIGINAGSGSTDLLLENDGTGAFANISSQLSPNPSQDDNDSKFFDYDDDGDLDLIIARLGSGGERVYNNDGAGNFTQVSNIVPIISDSSLDVVVADLTGNGKLDIVTAQGESGSFVNRIYINSGPADSVRPRIVATERADHSSDSDYVVRAAIVDGMSSDRNFFNKKIELVYRIDDALPQRTNMKYSGGQIYRGEIPLQKPGARVRYWVVAQDFSGNISRGGRKRFVAQ